MNRSLTNTAHAHTVRVDDFAAQMRKFGTAERAAIAEAIDRQDVAELERAAIARRIKVARKEAGLTQPEMAEALGVIQRTYQNYESVKDPRVPWGSMNEIAKITGKTTEWLIHGDATAARASQVDDGFDEFRQYVVDIRRDIADLAATIQMITDAIGLTGPDATTDALARARELTRQLAEDTQQSREAS